MFLILKLYLNNRVSKNKMIIIILLVFKPIIIPLLLLFLAIINPNTIKDIRLNINVIEDIILYEILVNKYNKLIKRLNNIIIPVNIKYFLNFINSIT